MIRASDMTGPDPAIADAEPPAAPPAAARDRAVLPQLRGKLVCPFCGTVREKDPQDLHAPCPKCTMSDSPQTRQATKARIGPWFVRQSRNPAAPGMKFETLLGLVRRGQVASHSVVRGPTTHQLWRFAANVKGLSREFGLCYSCGTPIERTANLCPACNRLQEPPLNPDVLLEGSSNAAAAPAAGEKLPVQREVRPAEPAAVEAKAPAVKPSPKPVRKPDPRPDPTPQPQAPAAAAAPDRTEVAAEEPAAAPEPPPAPPRPARKPEVLPLHEPFERIGPAEGTAASVLESAARIRSQSSGPSSQPRQRESSAAQPPRPPREHRDPRPAARPEARDAGGNRSDQLLTAEELAAAFQLDFKPKAAAARQRAGAPRSYSGGGTGKLVAALLLLGIGASAVALVFLPDLRRDALDWAQGAYASVRQAIDGKAKTPVPPTRPTPAAPDVLAARHAPTAEPATEPAPPQRSVAAPPPVEPPAPDPTPTDRAPTVAAATPSGPVAAAPASPANPLGVTITDAPPVVDPTPPVPAKEDVQANAAPKPPVVAEPEPTEPAPPAAPAEIDPELAFDKARVLWREALDAEARGDFAAAVRTYEQIQQLPPDAHPAGLEIRLKVARRLGR